MTLERGLLSLIVLVSLILPGTMIVTGSGSRDQPDDLSSIGPMATTIDGNWTITGTDLRDSESIILDGNLSIHGDLTLDNTDLVMKWSEGNPRTITVHDGGSFTIQNGSTIAGELDSRYYFVSNATSVVEINFSTVRDCGVPDQELRQSGIYTESDNFKVTRSVIQNGSTGIIGMGADIDLLAASIVNMDTGGVSLQNNSRLKGMMVNISESNSIGILSDRSHTELVNSRFFNIQRPIDSIESNMNLSFVDFSGPSPTLGSLSSSRVHFRDCSGDPRMGSFIEVQPPMSTSSDVLLLNTTYIDSIVLDQGALVRSAVRYDFRVSTNFNPPADGADMKIFNSSGDMIFEGSTDENGEIRDLEIDIQQFNLTGKYSLSPHNITVEYEGGSRYLEADLNSGHIAIIEVLLNDPVVEIAYPETGTWIPMGEFVVEGTIDDVRSIEKIWISIDGSQNIEMTPSQEFSIPVNLPDGEHDIRIIARNDDGRLGAGLTEFGIDSVHPELIISSPEDGIYTNSSNVLITGTCSEDADLYIGADMISNLDGTFKASVLLEDGLNDIRLRAVDRAGNTVMKTLTVYRDADPPTIIILSPVDGHRTNEGTVTLYGSVDSDTSILWINDEVVNIEDNKFQHEVELSMEGSNRIELKGRDRSGNEAVKTLIVIKDTQPPFLSINNAPQITKEDRIILRGTVDPGSKVLVNNRMIPVEGGTFQADVDLLEGENIIFVVARDDLGNEKTIQTRIVLDTTPPILDSISPSSGSILTNPIVQMRGEIYDETGIGSIRGKLNDGEFQQITAGENWTWVITLSDGVNIIDLEIEDSAGNILFRQLRYTLSASGTTDDEAPMVVISEPTSNESIPAGKILVVGWSMDNVEVTKVELRVDDGEWRQVEGIQNWEIEIDLAKGIYILEVRAYDTSGNIGTDSIWISVYIEEDGDMDDTDDESNWPLYIGLGLFILVISGMILYMLVIKMSYQKQLAEGSGEEEDKGEARRRPRTREGTSRTDDTPSPERRRSRRPRR